MTFRINKVKMLVVVTFYSTLHRMAQANVIKKIRKNRYEREKKKYTPIRAKYDYIQVRESTNFQITKQLNKVTRSKTQT